MAAILASLLFGCVSTSFSGSSDLEDWASETLLGLGERDASITLEGDDFLHDLISGGGSAGTTRLLSRLRGRNVLSHEKRWVLRAYLEANPGAHFEAIRGDLTMAVGTLAYHLWVLETGEVIKSWRDGRLRRYALSEHPVADEQPKLTDIQLALLKSIHRSPDITQRELAETAGVSQPAISYHIARMTELGIVRVERQGFHRRYSVTLDDVPRGP